VQSITKVSTDELAAEAGISAQMARDLARRGVFVRIARGKFDRAASMAAFLQHLRREKSGKRGGGRAFAAEGSEPNERSRLAAAQAVAQERKNAEASGRLVDAGEVADTWAGIVTATRDAILAASARIAADLPHLSGPDVATIDANLREALTRLAAQ
jgi:phage terminase Nu1 subunit (DNA packaging protein)